MHNTQELSLPQGGLMFGGYQFNNHAPVTWNSSGVSPDLKGLGP